MENLIPCPFCGGEAKVERYWNGKYGAECADENCSGFWSVSDTEQEAIAAWNQRAEQTCKGCYHEGLTSNDCAYCRRHPSLDDMWKEAR